MVQFVLQFVFLCLLLFSCKNEKVEPSIETSLLVADYLFVSKPVSDTCLYDLQLPPDMDHINTGFDTTIVRSATCHVHMMRLQHWGTASTYELKGNEIDFEQSIRAGEETYQWVDVTSWPKGEYMGYLMACGNGGGFTLRLE